MQADHTFRIRLSVRSAVYGALVCVIEMHEYIEIFFPHVLAPGLRLTALRAYCAAYYHIEPARKASAAHRSGERPNGCFVCRVVFENTRRSG